MKNLKPLLYLFLMLGIPSLLLGANENVVDCNIIFEQRKAEIMKEIELNHEQQQALQALQSTTQNVLDQKEQDLKKREVALNQKQKELEEKEESLERKMKRNEEILKQIKGATQSKIGETYSGMKDSKSAAILESLPDSEAAEILYALDTKIMSKILAKMGPQKAATLTKMLQKGPPFGAEEQEKDAVEKATTPTGNANSTE